MGMRRLWLAACAALLLATPAKAQGADTYPNRMVRVIVPLAAGGVADVMARMVADHLQTRFGQPFVVENRPGAGTAIGMDAVAKAAADGYTIGLGNIAANAITTRLPATAHPLSSDQGFRRHLARRHYTEHAGDQRREGTAKTLPEFIAYLKANPGKVTIRLLRSWHLAAHSAWSFSC